MTIFLCDAANKAVASVVFQEACPFVETAGPCGSEVCSDPASEDCQLAAAAYPALDHYRVVRGNDGSKLCTLLDGYKWI